MEFRFMKLSSRNEKDKFMNKRIQPHFINPTFEFPTFPPTTRPGGCPLHLNLKKDIKRKKIIRDIGNGWPIPHETKPG